MSAITILNYSAQITIVYYTELINVNPSEYN